ncbi:MAG: L,D-transpeptidase [Neisseriaceae bacterium]|nr:L,D-transpeptidase [Neisseriaceae bacterium]
MKKTLLFAGLITTTTAFAADELVFLPDVAVYNQDRHVIVNIPQARVFLYDNGELLKSYPAGPGNPKTPTNLGEYEVLAIAKNPDWHIPKSIQKSENNRKIVKYCEDSSYPFAVAKKTLISKTERKDADGYVITNDKGEVVYDTKYSYSCEETAFIKFSNEHSLGLHGTNAPHRIPSWPSHGCVRMKTPDVMDLKGYVSRGTPVYVIHQRYTLNSDDNNDLWLGIYPNKYAGSKEHTEEKTEQLIAALHSWNSISEKQIDVAVAEKWINEWRPKVKQHHEICLTCAPTEKGKKKPRPQGNLKPLSWTDGLSTIRTPIEPEVVPEFTPPEGEYNTLKAVEVEIDSTPDTPKPVPSNAVKGNTDALF